MNRKIDEHVAVAMGWDSFELGQSRYWSPPGKPVEGLPWFSSSPPCAWKIMEFLQEQDDVEDISISCSKEKFEIAITSVDETVFGCTGPKFPQILCEAFLAWANRNT